MSVKAKLIPVLTEAGKQAVFKADTANIEVNITHIAVGSGQYEPTSDRTALEDEKLRVEILSSSINKVDYQMTLNTIFKDEDLEFYINEFGVYLEDGTLFAVWSSPTKTLAYKSIWSKPIFAFTLKIVDVNLDAINIVDQGLDLKLNYLNEFTILFNTNIRGSLHRLKKFYADKEKERMFLQMFEELKTEFKNKNVKQDKERNDNLLLGMTNMNAILKINEREIK